MENKEHMAKVAKKKADAQKPLNDKEKLDILWAEYLDVRRA